MSREEVGNGEDGQCHPPHPLGKACVAGPRPFPTVGAAAFTLPLPRLTFFTVSAIRTGPSSLPFSFCSLGLPCSPT